MRRVLLGLGPVGGLVCLASFLGADARDLTIEQRVVAQEAVERVRYSHQIGATTPFEDAVPRAVLEKKVRTYLKQSVALESIWSTPVTKEALQREIERMARDTLMPDRLAELFAALENDPFLVRECLARPVLAGRLARDFFTYDERIHEAARRRVEEVRADLLAGRLDPFAVHPARTVVELEVIGEHERSGESHDLSGFDGKRPDRLRLSRVEFDEWRARAPKGVGEISPVIEEREAFSVRVVLEEEPGWARIATYAARKRSWSEWWNEVEGGLDQGAVIAPPADGQILPTPGAPGTVADDHDESGAADANGADGSRDSCVPDDSWDNGSLDDIPEARTEHTAVWTGNEMIIWGGYSYVYRNTGARYDPATDTWELTSTTGSPAPRSRHTAVWTGSEMIVWGGWDGSSDVRTGGRYDPLTDSWMSTSDSLPLKGRYEHTAVWTGSEMIIWGGLRTTGYFQRTGSRYDPASDSWTWVNFDDAPGVRAAHTAVWTGTEMIVWGGYDQSSELNTGARYDPASDTWTPTFPIQAPQPRRDHTAVWTGSEMIVWGGHRLPSDYHRNGRRYDPVTDRWTPVTLTNAPTERTLHTAVWTGNEMIVWGGTEYRYLDNGGRYDPETNSWSQTSITNAPSARIDHTAVWTGDRMIVWGGGEVPKNTGGRYDPETNSWTPTSVGGAPEPRSNFTAVWSGSQMIVWGGSCPSGSCNTGSRYDPVTDTWGPTSTESAPAERWGHTAVWAGNEMIVWGGYFGHDTGGRYDPIADVWSPTSTENAPTQRYDHSAVWTGNRMVIWGGEESGTGVELDTGGRYDPQSDSWQPVSSLDAPAARDNHSAIWTGNEMVVWGGLDELSYLATGGRYDPTVDLWTPLSTVDAPSPRAYHEAVWTGSEMIVWGGYKGYPDYDYYQNGGRYNVETDAWAPTSTIDAPSGRTGHTALWIANLMVVWGGWDGSEPFDTGGRYDPTTDSWTPTSLDGVPSNRSGHQAVWTGDQMIVWGGSDGVRLSSGGRYLAGHVSIDDDGDGWSDCHGDCDDGTAATYPGAPEINDGLDNQCPGDPGYGVADETSGDSGFHNPDEKSEYCWDSQSGATEYEVRRSSSATMSSPCAVFTTTGTCWVDVVDPMPGEAFHYLNCPTKPNLGSWGQNSAGEERSNVCP